MATLTLGPHTIEFTDPLEVGQGGPETCHMSIDGRPVTTRPWLGRPRRRRFFPTPLLHKGCIRAPMRIGGMGFYLTRIDPLTLKAKVLSRGYGFMRLLSVSKEHVEFSTWWDDREIRHFRLA